MTLIYFKNTLLSKCLFKMYFQLCDMMSKLLLFPKFFSTCVVKLEPSAFKKTLTVACLLHLMRRVRESSSIQNN